jgi:surface polysaccharide O-acyltransferase-like enzyme
MKKSEYSLNADLVRILALFSVVGIHLLTPIYGRSDFFGGTIWWLTFLLNCLFRASVPLFIMLSGYLIIPKVMSVEETVRKTVKRIGVPFLFFYLVGHMYASYVAHARSVPYDYWAIFHNLSKNGYSYLYFLIVLAILYLLLPMWQAVFATKNKAMPWYLIRFFLGLSLVATLARYVSLRDGDVFHTYTAWVLWIGYFLYGYWVRLQAKKNQKISWLDVAWIGGGYLLTVVAGYWSYAEHWAGNSQWYIGGVTYPEEYFSLGVMMMALAGFRVLMNWQVPKVAATRPLFVKVVKWLAIVSFGVYLVHPLVIDILHSFFGVTADSPMMPNLVVYLSVSAFLTVTISIVISAILNVLPVMKKVVGK